MTEVRHLALEIVELDDALEGKYLELCNRDQLDYFFFIYDWRYKRDQTKVLLAMEGGEIVGMMLTFKKAVIQVRADREVAEKLLDHKDLDEFEILAPIELKDMIRERYRAPIESDTLMMKLEKGQEKLEVTEEPEPVGPEHAEEVTKLMNVSFPDFWGQVTPDKMAEVMKETEFLGIKDGDRIVSVGNTFVTDFVSNIFTVATDEKYRGRGYAKSIVSRLVSRIFEGCDTASIFVFPHNMPAVRAYEKVGFRPYKEYFLIKKGTEAVTD